MMLRSFAVILAATKLLQSVVGYGTTVYITESYCPATTTLATGTAGQTGAPTGVPYLIYVIPQTGPQLPKRDTSFPYVATDGTIASDSNNAARYQFDDSGRLTTNGGYISTSGVASYQNFAPSQVLGSISTTFAVTSNDTLSWTNGAFSPSGARFCSLNTIIQVVFKGEYPQGCNPVQLGVIEASKASSPDSSSTTSPAPTGQGSMTISTSTTTILSSPTVTTTSLPTSPAPGSVQGSLALANPIGCVFSDEVSPAIGSQGSYHSISILEECIDYCAGYLGNQCIDLPFVGIEAGSHCYCGTSYSGSSAPGSCNIPCTGNGDETCGGVNAMNVYQIISRNPSTLTLSCNPSSNSATPTSPDYPAPTTTGDPNCFDGSGYDGTVNDDYLILCDTELPGYDLVEVDATDLSDCIEQCSSAEPTGDGSTCVAVEYDILVSRKPCTLKYDIGPVNRGSNPFAQAAILVNQPSSPQISYGDGSSSTTSTSISVTISTTSLTTSSSSLQASVQTLLMTTTTTTTSTPQTSAAPSLPSVSTSAQTFPGTSSSPTTTSSLATVRTSSTGAPSLPSSSSAVQTTSIVMQLSSSSAATSPRVITSSTFSNPVTTTSVSSTAARSPSSTTSGVIVYPTPTASLCPSYNHQVMNVNNDNYNYEIECSTALNGAGGNSSTATSLNNCVRFCTLYNVALPFQCLGVNFYPNFPQGQTNCFLLGSVTGSACRDSSINAARLIYDGYTSPTDQNCAVSTTTSAPAQLSSTAQSTTSRAASSPATLSVSSASASRTSTSIALPSTTPPATTTTRISTLSTSTTFTSTSTCPTPPANNAECVPSSSTPQCFSYGAVSGNATTNYEVECQTQFTGSSLQALLVQSLADCIFWCQYANTLTANSCTGVTYTNGVVVQGGPNNCVRYSTLTCATRGNSMLDSARILGGSYPAIADYTSSFTCH